MGLGLRDSRRMERRRRRTQAFKWLVGLALLFAGAGFMFVSGQEVANQRVSRLERDIDALTAKVEALGKENAGLKASLAASKAEVRQWQDRYANDVPSGDGKELYAQVMGRLKQGVSAKRLGVRHHRGGRKARLPDQAADQALCRPHQVL